MKRKPKKTSVGKRVAGLFRAPDTDPLGSYTGTPADEQDAPTQDGDDI